MQQPDIVTQCAHLQADASLPQLNIHKRHGTGQPETREHLCIPCAVARAVSETLAGAESYKVIAPLDFRHCVHTSDKQQCAGCMRLFREGIQRAGKRQTFKHLIKRLRKYRGEA